jgi:hypothetical protein
MDLPVSPVAADSAPAVPAELLATLYRAAVDYVARATGCSKDVLFLPSQRGAEVGDAAQVALAFVDHYLEKVRGGPPPQPEVLRLIASALGVYFGELAIACFGGCFLALPADAATRDRDDEEDSESAEPQEDQAAAISRWRVELLAVPLVLDPIAMAVAALLPHGALEEDAEVCALSAHKA